MTVKCPNCGKDHEVNMGEYLSQFQSEKKAQASRENGKKGGRPRKLKEGPQK